VGNQSGSHFGGILGLTEVNSPERMNYVYTADNVQIMTYT